MKHKLKHFIATHTFHSTKSKKDFFSLVKYRKINSDWFGNETTEMKQNFFKLLKGRNLLDDDNISEKNSDDYALLLQLFIGRGEFFFCHWYAIDEQTINDRLSVTSGEKFFITMATQVDGPKIYVDKLTKYMKNLK
tara:strand:+ start:151 stop:558 length:408 start_codon:yes stop_codon:yes gene_type:complete